MEFQIPPGAKPCRVCNDQFDPEEAEFGPFVEYLIGPNFEVLGGRRPAETHRPTTICKRDYHLNDEDLRGLQYESRPNPHGYANDMQLYLLSDIQRVAAEKERRKAAVKKEKQARAAATAREQQQRKKQAQEAAAQEAEQALASYRTVGGAFSFDGRCRLPVEALELVLDALVENTLTVPDKVKLCAQELAKLSQVCTDFYIAVHDHALPQLADIAAALQANEPLPAAPVTNNRSSPQALGQAQLLQQVTRLRFLPGPSSKKLTWRFWDQLVRDPQGLISGYKLDTIKEAVKLIGCKVTGSKAELVVRLMQALGLQQPAAAPAKLLVALQEQRLRSGQA